MSILEELNAALNTLNVPLETGVFKAEAPDEYIVLTPMADVYEVFADNTPDYETQEVRISLFTKRNYLSRKKQIEAVLLNAGLIITGRFYAGYDEDTGYHNYAMDVLNGYNL